MESTLDLMTEEQRKFHEEFTQCQNWEELEALFEREEKLKESRKNDEIPHLDMTLEEFRAKYHTVSYEDVKRKMCGDVDN